MKLLKISKVCTFTPSDFLAGCLEESADLPPTADTGSEKAKIIDGWIFSVSRPQINESCGFQPGHDIYSTVTWEKMRTLCPSSLSFFSIFWSNVSFPEDFTSRLPSYEPLGNTGASCRGQKNQNQTSTGEMHKYNVVGIIIGALNAQCVFSAAWGLWIRTMKTKDLFWWRDLFISC